MKNSKIKLITVIMLGVIFMTSCEDDNPIDPIDPVSATISGTITFTGEWPADDSVAVSLISTWMGDEMPKAINYIKSSNLSNSNTFDYTFDNISFGSYEAIAVSWRDFDDTMINETVGLANECNVTFKRNINDLDSILLTGTHPDIFSFLCELYGPAQSINENEMHELIEDSVILKYV